MAFSNTFTLVNKGEDLQVSIDIAKQLYVEKNQLSLFLKEIPFRIFYHFSCKSHSFGVE